MKKYLQKILEISLRNRIILNIVDFPARKNRVNLNWAPVTRRNCLGLVVRKKDARQNLGDYLAEPILEYMLDRNGIDRDQKVQGTKHLYTIGSIVLIGQQDATVWGSGILMEEPADLIWKRNKYRKLDVRCVRGPLTMARLKQNGIDVSKCKMGDPGVLMPLIYRPEVEATMDYGIIVHMSQQNDEENSKYKDHMIDILTDDYKKTIEKICNCKLIISSTLHGIILSESYGIPSILLNKFEFDDFKYRDYYLSTGRNWEEVARADTIEQALKLEKPEVPDLGKLQSDLIYSFPIDLWK